VTATHEQIMKFRETLNREYDRLWVRKTEAYYNREAERQYQQLWQEVLKKQKVLKLSPTPADSSRPRAS
jgi:hypothetical protein